MKGNKTVINEYIKDNLNIKNFVMLLGFALIILGAVNSTIGNVAGGTSCFVVAVILITLFFFEVKSFKVLGMAAELGRKINEADEILAKLRGISLPVSEIAIMSASQMGWVHEPLSARQLHNYVTTICKELEGMKVDDDAIDNAKRSWYSITINQMTTAITEAIRSELKSRIQKLESTKHQNRADPSEVTTEQAELNKNLLSEARKELASFNKDIKKMEGVEDISIIEWLSLAMNKYQTIPQIDRDELQKKLSEQLLDLEFFITKKKLRRSEVWLSQ